MESGECDVAPVLFDAGQPAKRCSTCGVKQPIKEFYRRGDKKRDPRCRSCERVRIRKWLLQNPDKARKYFRDGALRDRGLSSEEYEQMLLAQNGLCAICLKPEVTVSRAGKVIALQIDHCHKTGKIRGLLCRKCNLLLGHADDRTDLLAEAKNYLLKHSEHDS